jgi:hypothetical protein
MSCKVSIPYLNQLAVNVQELLESEQSRLKNVRLAAIPHSEVALHFKTGAGNEKRSFFVDETETQFFGWYREVVVQKSRAPGSWGNPVDQRFVLNPACKTPVIGADYPQVPFKDPVYMLHR